MVSADAAAADADAAAGGAARGATASDANPPTSPVGLYSCDSMYLSEPPAGSDGRLAAP
jgi:hypothetical protein